MFPRSTPAALPSGLRPGGRAGTAALCGLLVAASGLARAIACSDDFWLDEIWSYFAARRLTSAWGVFTEIRNSNNHHLNTLFLYWLGEREGWVAYRLPSLAAGVATVALAGALGARRGRAEAVFATLLTGASFALLQYASEARGYALAVAFALGAWAVLLRFLRRPSAGAALLFGGLVLLGVLSHLTFLFFYAGAALQSAGQLLASRAGWRRGAARLVGLHALPLLGCALLYAVDLRHMTVGRGPPAELGSLVARSFGFGFGLPVWPELAPLYALLGAVLLVLGCRLLWREGDSAVLMFPVCIVLAPLLALGWLRPEVVEPRYFLVGIAFGLLLSSFLLARLYRSGPRARAASLALAALFVLGNARHTADFWRDGRGGYREAVRLMARLTEGPRITVGSDQDLRNAMALAFYQRVLPPGKEFAYFRRGGWPGLGTEWLITHQHQRPAAVPARLFDDEGNGYAFTAEYGHAGLSGFWWGVYRNEARAGRALEGGE